MKRNLKLIIAIFTVIILTVVTLIILFSTPKTDGGDYSDMGNTQLHLDTNDKSKITKISTKTILAINRL